MSFIENTPKKVKTKYTTSSIKTEAVLFSMFAGFACYTMFSFVESLGRFAPFGLGFLGAAFFYKLQLKSIEDDAYESIDFFKDHFVVNFECKPKLKISYKDVVSVSAAFEEQPTTLTLTGDYPILFLVLNPLEKDYDKNFVNFLVEKGFVS